MDRKKYGARFIFVPDGEINRRKGRVEIGVTSGEDIRRNGDGASTRPAVAELPSKKKKVQSLKIRDELKPRELQQIVSRTAHVSSLFRVVA